MTLCSNANSLATRFIEVLSLKGVSSICVRAGVRLISLVRSRYLAQCGIARTLPRPGTLRVIRFWGFAKFGGFAQVQRIDLMRLRAASAWDFYRVVRALPAVVSSRPPAWRRFGSWKTAWATAKERAGVECRMHDLRHRLGFKTCGAGNIAVNN